MEIYFITFILYATTILIYFVAQIVLCNHWEVQVGSSILATCCHYFLSTCLLPDTAPYSRFIVYFLHPNSIITHFSKKH